MTAERVKRTLRVLNLCVTCCKKCNKECDIKEYTLVELRSCVLDLNACFTQSLPKKLQLKNV